MDELAMRKKAMELFSSAVSVTQICRILKKSRVWFYKWKLRYQNNTEGEWFSEQSRRPHNIKKNLIRRLSPKSLRFGGTWKPHDTHRLGLSIFNGSFLRRE